MAAESGRRGTRWQNWFQPPALSSAEPPVVSAGCRRKRTGSRRPVMSDYRDPLNRDPTDPLDSSMRRSEMRQPNSGLGWIAGALFMVVVLALIFGLGRTGERTANTGSSPPAATTGSAPPPAGGPATAPRGNTGSGQ